MGIIKFLLLLRMRLQLNKLSFTLIILDLKGCNVLFDSCELWIGPVVIRFLYVIILITYL